MQFSDCLRKQFARFRGFWAAVPGSLKNHLNAEELARIVIAALSAGGGLYGCSQAIMLNLGAIFPAPADAAFAGLVLTTIVESRRRLRQGTPLKTNPHVALSRHPLNRSRDSEL